MRSLSCVYNGMTVVATTSLHLNAFANIWVLHLAPSTARDLGLAPGVIGGVQDWREGWRAGAFSNFEAPDGIRRAAVRYVIPDSFASAEDAFAALLAWHCATVKPARQATARDDNVTTIMDPLNDLRP